MSLPSHPISERGACWFHAGCAAIGMLHIGLGLAIIWYHLEATRRHWRAR